ncbi:Uncharacterised protein [Phocoenobacter uteri]|uniref:Uncharacterized protein n=1 Tax=Phocoenobacter uteri TaxID=146806 RepID=A0A379C8G5_9PAST|nr:hypothetical protein [Phocoenobacter uteri]MDG6882397.1 hypothetical protein [Phocoenobacter uteri]SUB58554.1 Uncharacterised protein [Phocoenobacter uteri]
MKKNDYVLINSITSVLILFPYPYILFGAVMILASPTKQDIYSQCAYLLCYFVLLYPISCIIGWIGTFINNKKLSLVPLYHIAIFAICLTSILVLERIMQ